MWRFVSPLVALGAGLWVFDYYSRQNPSHIIEEPRTEAAIAHEGIGSSNFSGLSWAQADVGAALDSLSLQAARRKEDLVLRSREAIAAAAEQLKLRDPAGHPKSGPQAKPAEQPSPSILKTGVEPASATSSAHPPPDFVPWPPPVPTTTSKLEDWMHQFRTVGELSASLEHEQETGDYSQFSYSWVPNGFALVTQVEQLDDNELPLSEHRFAPSECYIPLSEMRITVAIFSSVKGLLFEREDRCRLYVFFLTDDLSPPQEYPAEQFNQKVVRNWVEKGRRSLTKAEKEKPISEDYTFYVNEYEFIKHKGEDPTQAPASDLSAVKHLGLTGCSFALK